jgi:hypothetical protein
MDTPLPVSFLPCLDFLSNLDPLLFLDTLTYLAPGSELASSFHQFLRLAHGTPATLFAQPLPFQHLSLIVKRLNPLFLISLL